MASKNPNPSKGDLTWVVQQKVARIYRISDTDGKTFSGLSLDDPFKRGGLFCFGVPVAEFRPYEPGVPPVKSAGFQWTSYEFPKAKP